MATPTSELDSLLQALKNVNIFFFIASFIVSRSHETFVVKKIAGFGGGPLVKLSRAFNCPG